VGEMRRKITELTQALQLATAGSAASAGAPAPGSGPESGMQSFLSMFRSGTLSAAPETQAQRQSVASGACILPKQLMGSHKLHAVEVLCAAPNFNGGIIASGSSESSVRYLLVYVVVYGMLISVLWHKPSSRFGMPGLGRFYTRFHQGAGLCMPSATARGIRACSQQQIDWYACTMETRCAARWVLCV
jgi:hypothetical protein